MIVGGRYSPEMVVAAFAVIVTVVVSAIDFSPSESCAQNPNVATPGDNVRGGKIKIAARCPP